MTTVRDSAGNEIGHCDGRFVYDRVGERRYWIDDGDVFSMPPIDREDDIGTRAVVKIAVLTDGIAIDDNGATVFIL
jgi:hypothetical protein